MACGSRKGAQCPGRTNRNGLCCLAIWALRSCSKQFILLGEVLMTTQPMNDLYFRHYVLCSWDYCTSRKLLGVFSTSVKCTNLSIWLWRLLCTASFLVGLYIGQRFRLWHVYTFRELYRQLFCKNPCQASNPIHSKFLQLHQWSRSHIFCFSFFQGNWELEGVLQVMPMGKISLSPDFQGCSWVEVEPAQVRIECRPLYQPQISPPYSSFHQKLPGKP